MSHQHGPNPDYSIHHEKLDEGDIQPVTITCRDCGDIEMQFVRLSEVVERIKRKRCDECQDQHDENRHIQARAAVDAVLDMTVRDETEIICDSCSEPACSYDRRNVSPDSLEGKAHICESCGDGGKLYLHEPDGGDCFAASLRFRPYTANEIDALEGL
jgi:hypothetical protein